MPSPEPPRKVLVDGRVFSTGAHDRGMGRYLAHLIDLLKRSGHEVTLLLFRECHLSACDPLLEGCAVRFANYDPESQDFDETVRQKEAHAFTTFLTQVIVSGDYEAYLDGTPFLRPARLDIIACPTISICYDFIPMKHPDYYIPGDRDLLYYHNGLARLFKADHVICISNTVREELTRYLGTAGDQASVITPRIDAPYSAPLNEARIDRSNPFLFCILGSHKSKNPQGALRLLQGIVDADRLAVRVNVPTDHQYADLKRMSVPKDIRVTFAISEKQKQKFLDESTVIVHFSLEEGFGIPLLEALFSGKKVIALDIPMNREIIGHARTPSHGAVHLVPVGAETMTPAALDAFLDASAKISFYDEIRDHYFAHWNDSADVLSGVLAQAAAHWRAWLDDVEFKIVSSIPGSSCGIADYSIAYIRSSDRNVMLFFSEGDERNVAYIKNIRACSVDDFEVFSRIRPEVPGLFNFGFSDALYPGISLLRRHATVRDRLLVHEREYAGALQFLMRREDQLDPFLLESTRLEEPQASRLALAAVTSAAFNRRRSQTPRAPFPSDWLARLPVRLISHLSPPMLEKMQEMAQDDPASVLNELVELEDRLEFVPLGIDDRTNPALGRAAAARRRRHGLQPDDLLVGHFGLVLPGIKRLAEVTRGVAQAAAAFRETGRTPRRIFFSVSGKVLDENLFAEMRASFEAVGLGGRLLHTNPVLESDFDAEIAACDLVACLRTQRRGQASHILVRAFALGRPVIVNRNSGYAYDPRTTIADEDIEGGMGRVIRIAMNRSELADMRRWSRALYQQTHRGDASLRQILEPTASA